MKSCLIVDDSKVVRLVARKIIEDLGFSVREAENGQQALDKVTEAMPDVILLDWGMPVMDGMAFFEKMKTLPSADKARVVFCATENDIDHIRRALDAGADEYIMKPFDSEIIQAKFNLAGVFDEA